MVFSVSPIFRDHHWAQTTTRMETRKSRSSAGTSSSVGLMAAHVPSTPLRAASHPREHTNAATCPLAPPTPRTALTREPVTPSTVGAQRCLFQRPRQCQAEPAWSAAAFSFQGPLVRPPDLQRWISPKKMLTMPAHWCATTQTAPPPCSRRKIRRAKGAATEQASKPTRPWLGSIHIQQAHRGWPPWPCHQLTRPTNHPPSLHYPPIRSRLMVSPATKTTWRAR